MSKVKIKTKSIIRNTKEWDRIKNEIAYLKNSVVKVGFPEKGSIKEVKKGSTKDMKGIIKIATINEFGTDDGRIPARPFVSTSADEQKQKIKQLKEMYYKRILDGKETVKSSLDKMGLWMVGKIKRKITTLNNPPNAPATIAKKGVDNPLIDSGQMRASTQHKTELKR